MDKSNESALIEVGQSFTKAGKRQLLEISAFCCHQHYVVCSFGWNEKLQASGYLGAFPFILVADAALHHSLGSSQGDHCQRRSDHHSFFLFKKLISMCKVLLYCLIGYNSHLVLVFSANPTEAKQS